MKKINDIFAVCSIGLQLVSFSMLCISASWIVFFIASAMYIVALTMIVYNGKYCNYNRESRLLIPWYMMYTYTTLISIIRMSEFWFGKGKVYYIAQSLIIVILAEIMCNVAKGYSTKYKK